MSAARRLTVATLCALVGGLVLGSTPAPALQLCTSIQRHVRAKRAPGTASSPDRRGSL